MTEQTWRQANIKKAQAARSKTAEEGWARRLIERGWFCMRGGREALPYKDCVWTDPDTQIYATNSMRETCRVVGWTGEGKPILDGNSGEFVGTCDYFYSVGPK